MHELVRKKYQLAPITQWLH